MFDAAFFVNVKSLSSSFVIMILVRTSDFELVYSVANSLQQISNLQTA